jgi:hypothetical protein
MDLEAARGLKRHLGELMPSALSSDYGIETYSIQERTVDEARPAIGIAPVEPGEFRVAVRVQDKNVLDATKSWTEKEFGEDVDLVFIGRAVKFSPPWHQTRQRPLRAGCSVSHEAAIDAAGTLGAFVVGEADNDIRMLSNNHVLAIENTASAGDSIVQPGTADGGGSSDQVGQLETFLPLDDAGANYVDGAVASVDASADLPTAATPQPQPDDKDVLDADEVEKTGRTTGFTEGRVRAFELDDVTVGYDMGDLRFDGVIEIDGEGNEPFSSPGDSGSVVVRRGASGSVGLLFGGTPLGGRNGRGLTYACPMPTVLRELHLRLLA